MSMWISSIKQLDPVRHLLSPLLLDFMAAAWPSSISMVIPRGIVSMQMCVLSILVQHEWDFYVFIFFFVIQAHGWTSSA